MLAIILSVCLISNPAICRSERIPVGSNLSPGRCAMDAAPRIAKWSEEHPRWRVVRWRCGGADEREI
jgi:hypothetical protein